VVIQSERGIELGEVLIGVDEESLPDSSYRHETHENDSDDGNSVATISQTRVLRAAASEDLARATQINDLRPVRFAQCQRIIEEAGWPWQLVDIEPLLDGQATILHYLGPQPHDAALVRARFRVACDFDVLLEPVGREPEEIESEDAEEEHGCGGGGSCGSCSHGSDATSERTTSPPASPSPSANDSLSVPEKRGTEPSSCGGCDSCGVRPLMAARRSY